MPHKDPEARRAYTKAYNARNRDRQKAWKKANRSSPEWRAKHAAYEKQRQARKRAEKGLPPFDRSQHLITQQDIERRRRELLEGTPFTDIEAAEDHLARWMSVERFSWLDEWLRPIYQWEIAAELECTQANVSYHQRDCLRRARVLLCLPIRDPMVLHGGEPTIAAWLATAGGQVAAAKRMGVPQSTFYSRLQRAIRDTTGARRETLRILRELKQW